MAELLALEIVTPEGVQLAESVRELTAPSVGGEVGILPGHRPLMAALRTGVVSYRVGAEERRVAVGRGFLDVSVGRAVVLTDRFIRKEDVDAVRVRLELKDADLELSEFRGDRSSHEFQDVVQRELWAATQLTLIGDPPPPVFRPQSEFHDPVDYAALAWSADEQQAKTEE